MDNTKLIINKNNSSKAETNLIFKNKSKKDSKIKLGKKRKAVIKKQKISNPAITRFNIDSFFIYDMSKKDKLLLSFNEKNNIKLNEREFALINEKINKLYENIELRDNIDFININLEEYLSIKEYFIENKEENNIEKLTKDYINKCPSKENITCSKLCQLCWNKLGVKIGKTKMFYILKNRLNLRFLRTNVKTDKIITPNSIFSCLCFIKIIIRGIIQGFNIYFMDESSILSKNNHFKCWRKKKENVYNNISIPKRANLLLVVSKDKVIYFEINEQGTNQKTFIKFLEGFIKSIENEDNKKYILVLDNLSAHKTPEVTNFLIDNKINVIYNSPYVSEFNCVELSFRYIKKIIYSKIYETIENTIKDVENLLKSKEIQKTLIKNFCETLQTYIEYSNKYKYVNLNNLKYEFK